MAPAPRQPPSLAASLDERSAESWGPCPPSPAPLISRTPGLVAVYYGDVHVGTIARRAGCPVDVDRWEWRCGFYPGMEPDRHRSETAVDFAAAREGFEAAWREIQPTITDPEFTAWKHAMLDAGMKMPTQFPSGRSRCYCGASLTIGGTPDLVASGKRRDRQVRGDIPAVALQPRSRYGGVTRTPIPALVAGSRKVALVSREATAAGWVDGGHCTGSRAGRRPVVETERRPISAMPAISACSCDGRRQGVA